VSVQFIRQARRSPATEVIRPPVEGRLRSCMRAMSVPKRRLVSQQLTDTVQKPTLSEKTACVKAEDVVDEEQENVPTRLVAKNCSAHWSARQRPTRKRPQPEFVQFLPLDQRHFGGLGSRIRSSTNFFPRPEVDSISCL